MTIAGALYNGIKLRGALWIEHRLPINNRKRSSPTGERSHDRKGSVGEHWQSSRAALVSVGARCIRKAGALSPTPLSEFWFGLAVPTGMVPVVTMEVL